MRILKYIFFTLLGIVVLALITALFLPKTFKAEATIVIDKPKQQVFDYVKNVSNQQNFGVWFQMDDEMKISSEGMDGTEGFVYKWESEKVGNGSQSITKIVANDSVLSSLDFGFGEPADGYFSLKAISPHQTSVTWGISGKTPYPFNLMSLFFDMNKDFEQGVQNLKKVLESQEISKNDKSFIFNYYDETFDNLQQKVSGLNKEQMHFKPNEELWSISQCLEHIVITENMIFGMIKETMEKPANPERKVDIKFSDEQIMAMATDRSEKHKAPEVLIAKGKYDNPESALEELKNQRTEILAFVENTLVEDLRNHIGDGPAGATDVYQSLIFLAGHTARHTLQIDEIKENTDFPK